MLSYGYWSRAGRDPDIVGRTVRLDDEAWTVIGVLPRGFKYPVGGRTDLWIPLAADRAESRWCGYAWPEKHGETGRRTLFVSQTGDVWATDGADSVVPDLTSYPEETPPKDGRAWKRVP